MKVLDACRTTPYIFWDRPETAVKKIEHNIIAKGNWITGLSASSFDAITDNFLQTFLYVDVINP